MRLLFLLFATIAFAQSPNPCTTADHKRFDFWLGEWTVRSGERIVGRSRIEKVANGCVVIEHWTSAAGEQGKSLNWWDTSGVKWRQLYVGLNWHVEYSGEWSGGSLRFSGTQRLPSGEQAEVRLTFTPEDGGEIRQHKQRLARNEWVDVYDFHYSRGVPAGPAPVLASRCAAPECRQFDFWVGGWDVFLPNGNRAGGNQIENAVHGCLIFENWTGARGLEGKSFNFYDAGSRQWRQAWVSAQGALDLRGEWKDGSLRYAGETRRAQDVLLHRLTFTPNADGSVRQLWEQSADQGKTWSVAFDGKYVRKS